MNAIDIKKLSLLFLKLSESSITLKAEDKTLQWYKD